MTELTEAERFVVNGFRRWVTGLCENDGRHWNLVQHEYARRLGPPDDAAALAGLAGLVRGLLLHARRPVQYHRPCCPYVASDEIRLTGLIAACQTGSLDVGEGLAAWLVTAHGIAPMLEAGQALGGIMGHHGLTLPAPPAETARHERTSRELLPVAAE
jgi:hypothetical protein